MISTDLETDARNAGRNWATKLPVSKIINSYNDCHKHPDPDLPPRVSIPVVHAANRDAWVHHFWEGVLETMSPSDIGKIDNT
jgi:hypothetical protein